MRLSDFHNSMAGHCRRSVTFSAHECFAFLRRRRDFSNGARLLARHEFQAVLIDVASVPDIAKQLIVLPLARFRIVPLLALRGRLRAGLELIKHPAGGRQKRGPMRLNLFIVSRRAERVHTVPGAIKFDPRGFIPFLFMTLVRQWCETPDRINLRIADAKLQGVKYARKENRKFSDP